MNFKMKNTIYILCAAVLSLFAACTPEDGNKTVINAKNLSEKAGIAYIYDYSNTLLDSVVYSNGEFSLSYSKELPERVMMYVYDSPKENLLFLSSAFLEPGTFTFNTEGCNDDFRGAKIEGSVLQMYIKEYEAYINGLEESKEEKRLSQESTIAFKDGNKFKVNELNASRDSLRKIIVDKIFDYKVKGSGKELTSKENEFAKLAMTYKICEMAYSMSLEDQITLEKRFPADYAASVDLNNLRSEIAAESKLAIGAPAPDFSLQDIDGKTYSIKDFAGKYVYINFSASWCGWCKREMPYIREAFEKTKGKDIVFITINMDEEKDVWEKEIKNENITWMCLSNLQGMKSDLAKSYNIHGIPACFVLDKEGKFLKKDVRTNEMVDYITGLFKK